MPSAGMVSALVNPNIKVIRILGVDQSVFWTQSVLGTKLVFALSVKILVQERVARMPFVALSTIFQFAAVQQECQEIHSFFAFFSRVSVLNIFNLIRNHHKTKLGVSEPPANSIFFLFLSTSSVFWGHREVICYRCIAAPVVTQPCNPNPCGPHSICREINNQGVCSCAPGFIGSPPVCRPECVINADCGRNEACNNQKCRNPCPGTCGVGARCEIVNHNPICSCPPRYTGDPFVRCLPIRKWTIDLFQQ